MISKFLWTDNSEGQLEDFLRCLMDIEFVIKKGLERMVEQGTKSKIGMTSIVK